MNLKINKICPFYKKLKVLKVLAGNKEEEEDKEYQKIIKFYKARTRKMYFIDWSTNCGNRDDPQRYIF